MEENMQTDIYIENLMNNKQEINNCQTSQGFSSCMQCNKILECSIRTRYVDSVYESMSKGQVGDFDFN